MENLFKFGITLILAVISAIFYRMGGSDTYDTKWRDIGCALVTGIGLLIYSGFENIAWVGLSTLFLFGALTTYWKCLNKFFGKPKDNCFWFNWLAVGIGYSLSVLPLVWHLGIWRGFLIRTLVLSITTMVWSEYIDKVVYEECGRGGLLLVTIPLLFV